MRRLINFRAWDTKNKKWLGDIFNKVFISANLSGGALLIAQSKPYRLCGYSTIATGETRYDIKEINLLQTIFTQSTGLFDKNGKEIFENDIVKTTRIENSVCEANIVYEYDKDYTGVVKMLEGAWVIDTGSNAIALWSEIEENEIVGNIYEQPDFLKKRGKRK